MHVLKAYLSCSVGEERKRNKQEQPSKILTLAEWTRQIYYAEDDKNCDQFGERCLKILVFHLLKYAALFLVSENYNSNNISGNSCTNNSSVLELS